MIAAMVDGMAAKAGRRKAPVVLSYIGGGFAQQGREQNPGTAACGACSCVPTCSPVVIGLRVSFDCCCLVLCNSQQQSLKQICREVGRQASAQTPQGSFDQCKTGIASSVLNNDNVTPVCC